MHQPIFLFKNLRKMKNRDILPLIFLAVAATLLPIPPVLSNANESFTLKLVHHFHKTNGKYPEGKADNVPRVFKNNLDYYITLKAGYVTVSKISLNRCDSALTVGNAQTTQTPAGQQPSLPVVESILRADFEPLAVANLQPSPGSYCNLFVSLEPATADAVRLPNDTDVVGKTLYLQGEYVSPGSGQAVPFEISSDRLATQAVPFHNAKGEDIKLNFTGENDPKEAIIGMAYDGWLDNVDFAKMNELVRAKTVMDNMLQSLHYHTGHVYSSDNQHHSGHQN